MKSLIVITIIAVLAFIFSFRLKLIRNGSPISDWQDTRFKFFYELKPWKKQIGWVPYESTQTINRDNLNERFDYPVQKAKDTFRIITLGGSVTFGLYVDTKDNWTERLEDMLNGFENGCNQKKKFEVINLGVHGYDIAYTVERFRLRGVKYDPDLVIWFLTENEIMQINEAVIARDKVIAYGLKETHNFDNLVKQGDLYPSWQKAISEVSEALGDKTIRAYQKKYLGRFNNYFNGPLLIVLTTKPRYETVLNQYVGLRQNTYLYQYVTNLADIPGAMSQTGQHPTKTGHDIIAKDIYDYLIYNKLLTCSF